MEAKFSNGNLMTSLRQSRLYLVDIVRQQFGTKCDESEARNTPFLFSPWVVHCDPVSELPLVLGFIAFTPLSP